MQLPPFAKTLVAKKTNPKPLERKVGCEQDILICVIQIRKLWEPDFLLYQYLYKTTSKSFLKA